MNMLECYGELPDFLCRAAEAPPLRRLKEVGMNCGCEYTSFPMLGALAPYSRWEHSLGVAAIVWRFTGDPKQAMAGLLHDVASPTFAHVIDFLKGDYLRQEATEAGTTRIIDESPELQTALSAMGLCTADVCDYHRYPIADNDTPRLSADRLEYTLGNLVNFGYRSRDDVAAYYADLAVGENEAGEQELMFQSPARARGFALDALRCSRIYVSDADRYAMQALANLLRDAVAAGVLSEDDFMGTEPRLLDKLCRHRDWADRWRDYCAMRATRRSEAPDGAAGWMKIPAKKRCIDPMVRDVGRASALFPDFGDALAAFLAESQDYWVLGE